MHDNYPVFSMDPSIISEESNVQQLGESKNIRKREVDATEFERLQTHPKATQLELTYSFYTKFNKQINQSTAMGSRNVESYM